jgi:hypothetical protein
MDVDPTPAQVRAMLTPDEWVPCRTCGYDLRGLSRDGDCPECGTAIAASLTVAGRFAPTLARIQSGTRILQGVLCVGWGVLLTIAHIDRGQLHLVPWLAASLPVLMAGLIIGVWRATMLPIYLQTVRFNLLVRASRLAAGVGLMHVTYRYLQFAWPWPLPFLWQTPGMTGESFTLLVISFIGPGLSLALAGTCILHACVCRRVPDARGAGAFLCTAAGVWGLCALLALVLRDDYRGVELIVLCFLTATLITLLIAWPAMRAAIAAGLRRSTAPR